jgi:hypothetical protein
MKLTFVGCAVLAVLLSFGSGAEAGPPPIPVCCACADLPAGAQASGFLRTNTAALFCVDTTSNETDDVKMRCTERDPNAVISCVQKVSALTCSQQLQAEFGVTCPGAGAPVTGAAGLALLVATMGMVGVVAVRRRGRS